MAQTEAEATIARPSSGVIPEYDFIIIGAGVCGLYQLYRLLSLGTKVTVLDANPDLGGTWYRNRYSGCRFDSESYSYGYSFSREVLEEWDWTEHFASQPETLRYLNYVADKFGLRRHIQFGCRVVGATYEEATRSWRVRLEGGGELTTRFLMTAIGLLSVPSLPRYEGMNEFRGPAFHTYYWPSEGVPVAGKRVGVIGTGPTGVQVISTIAGEVSELIVFQRRPNWCAPLGNRPISPSEMEEIKRSYDEIFERCRNSPSGFIHSPDPRKALEVSESERTAFWETLYHSPGFGIWLGNFKDVLTDVEANRKLSEFVAGKIRQRVKDPIIAEKLIPRDHGFGTRRVPLESNYYEVYNRPNVRLVDLNETPIERITRAGIRTSDREYPLDVIVYATGFDAITGAFDRIDFTGVGGLKLRDKWDKGVTTFLGVQTVGFPNLFMLAGPQSASVATNFPRGIEEIVDWVTELVTFLLRNGYTRVEPKAEAEREWVAHVEEASHMVLFAREKSWFTGFNPNAGREYRLRHLVYAGGALRYRRRLNEEVESGYASFRME